MARRRHAGFTLVELLVVIAVIAILASLILPAAARAKERGRIAKCASNLRQITLALQMYTDDNEVYPNLQTAYAPPPAFTFWCVALTNYLSIGNPNSPVFHCPSFKYPGMTNPDSIYYGYNWNYGYNGNGAYSLSVGSPGPNVPLIKQSEVVAPSRMIAFSDSQLYALAGDSRTYGSMTLTYIPISHGTDFGNFRIQRQAVNQRHMGRYQTSFCDGHIESLKHETLFADTPETRRLWNRDNEPH